VPKFISLNALGFHVRSGATIETGFGPNSGVALPDALSPAFETAFVIPPDYTPGTPLVIHMLWHTASTGCTVAFQENFISVGRAGTNHLLGPNVTTGLTIVGGTVLSAAPTPNQSKETLIEVTSPGDSIHFGFFRPSSSGNDTCTQDMKVQALWVTYE
jgi:hypothetical protein